MNTKSIPTKLEIHYYLKDDSHTMDAFVFNECEHELLILIKELQSLLYIKKFTLDVEAIAEGGIKSRLVLFVTDNQFYLSLLTIIGTVITARFADKTEIRLLEKEKLNLEIKILKRQLEKDTSNNVITLEMAEVISSGLKIAKRKSNYYTNLLKDERIAKISTSILDSDNQIIGEEHIVERSQFNDFILTTDELDSIIVEDAIIEIVSPVLKDKKISWKGIYEGKPLSSVMDDIEYIQQVITEKVVFMRGTFIECVLETKRKLNEIGEIKVNGYNVLVVIKSFNHSNSFETPQGIGYKEKRELGERYDDGEWGE